MVLPVLLAVLAQVDRPVAVVPSSNRPGTETALPRVMQQVRLALESAGVVLVGEARLQREFRFVDTAKCAGTIACIRKTAVVLGPRAVVVGVDVGKVGKRLAIHLEAVAADAEASLATADITSSSDSWSPAASSSVNVFAGELLEQLKKAPPPVDAPVADPLPRPGLVTKPEVPVVTEPPAPARPVPPGAWAALGGAVFSAGLAVTFGLLGSADQAALDAARTRYFDNTPGTTLTQAGVTSLVDSGNLKLSLSLTSAILTGLLGGLTAWLFIAR